MSEQRRYEHTDPLLRPLDASPPEGAGLDEARAELDALYASADAILDDIRTGNTEQFLERVRQSGGE